MSCPACGHENRPGRKFCVECGAVQPLGCPSCGAACEAGEKFCGECGAALNAAATRSSVTGGPAAPVQPAPTGGAIGDGARKVVTVVFADLVGSTALHERLDAESVQRVMARYYEALRSVVEGYGGTVVKLLGDGVMAAFGLRQVSEDDAIRAVRAAVAMQEAFRALVGSQPALATAGLRVGVNTGEVVVSGGEDDVIGDPVNVAARLQEQGRDGDVVVGEATRRLVGTRVTLAALGSVVLKGRAEAVAAYRVESLEPPAGASTTPFVGRDDELGRLRAIYDAALAAPATRLAVLLGSPGLGKSRLIDELGRRLGDAAVVLTAHCDAAGGATFAPLVAALRVRLGIEDGATPEVQRAAIEAALGADDADHARIAGGIAALFAGASGSPEETFFVVRRLLGALARAKPVVLVIDDLHWAEPLLLDLIEHLVQWGSGVPLFVLVGARPELRDLRSSLVTPGGLVGDVVTLGGLDAGAAMRLAANVIGAADLPAAVAAKVLATSEGNPLFVGELVRMLVQEGALTKDGERWTAGMGLASIEMPPTIHALLAARIERLRPEDRVVLERAAVVGRHFSRSAVAALLNLNGSELDARLESLRRSELIERDTGWLLGEPVMRFHHVLIRDAAYRRLLKGTRAELHARLADWIEGQVGDAPEHDETIGWHLEQAHQHLRELGPLDAAAAVLGERAARRLAPAGRRALARDDVALAASLLGRALDRLTPDAAERADLVLDWCEALLSAGDVGPAADAIAELDRVARGSERLHAWHTCFAGQLTVLTAPEALHAASERVGAAARALATLDDAAGEAKAHFVHAQALARLGKIGASEAALDQALAAARRAGDRRRANAVLAGAPLAALWGPSPVTRASGRCLDVVRVLRITQGAPGVEAVALSCQGVLEALRGRTEAARRMLASSRTMVEELGISHRLYESDVFAGRIDLLEGDAPAAERALRAGYEGLRDLGLGIDAARAAALLGRALLVLDRAADAETLSHESELLAGDDLQAAIAWRGVRAEALARRGDHAAAIAFAEAAVAIAAVTDALLDHADARLALAAALRAAGRADEANGEERRAIDLWEAKGATVLAGRAQRPADGEATAAPPTEARAEPRIQRRIRPNAATAVMARVDAALAARDLLARESFAESFEEVSHPTGTTYGREQMLRSLERFLCLPGAWVRHEILATLGDMLVLVRRWMGASAAGRERFDVGEYEKEEVCVFELDARGVHVRTEVFGADHLGDAIALLYRRYAEGLPPGPARERATVAAHAVAFILLPGETPDLNLLYAPTYRDVDHRTVGYGTVAREDADKLAGSFQAVAEDVRFRIDDVLALDPNGFVRQTTSSGVWREGGGAYERTVCTLTVFGSDGRVTGHETFEADRAVDALARFDALTPGAQPKEPVQRRVRPNAVTRAAAEFEGIVAARDFAALQTFFAEDAECIDHPTGATYGAAGMRTGIQRLMQSPDARLRFIPLAMLGDAWGLVRREMAASGAASGHFDVGAYEIVDVAIFGTDERGRICHVEIFAKERLGAAIVRLYELYAKSLSDGPASARASAVARALAVFDGPIEFDRIANGYAPSFEAVDRRILGTWSAHGREDWLTHWRGQLGLADDSSGRYDEVLALEPGAILVHQSFFGSSRTSGGVFEVVTLTLHLFDSDGLIARTELFEPDREAEALARFDALTADAAPQSAALRRVRPPRALRANAATATAARFEAAIAVRDEAALADTLAETLTVVDHANGADYGRDGVLTSFQGLLRMDDPTMHHEALATLGESLALFRRRIGGRGGRLDVGAYERDEVCVYDVDADGRFRHVETFAAERLRTALVRLYERYAESLPEGPARARASSVARAFVTFDGVDADRMASSHAPSFVCVDHRMLSTWSAQGREDWRRHLREQVELAADVALRDDDVLALDPGAHALRTTFTGISRASGGAFENVVITVSTHDADGLITRTEVFEPDQEAAALACFDALTAGGAPQPVARRPVRPPRALRANAASRMFAALEAAFARRDLAALDALLGDPLETIEHPTGTTYGREGQLESTRWMMRLPDLVFRLDPLATLGESLCLGRRFVAASTAGSGFDVGAYEIESIVVNTVDSAGRLVSSEVFARERLGIALVRLCERHAELLPEAPARARAAATARARATFGESATDPDVFAAALAPAIVAVDHRTVGFGELRGRDVVVAAVRALLELSEDVTWRTDEILALAEHADLMRATQRGRSRESGGEWERQICSLRIHGADGLIARWEIFESEQETAALARYDALVGPPGEPAGRAPADSYFANAATRTLERFVRASAARDWQALADLFADSLRFDDRRPLLQLQLQKNSFLEQHRTLFDVPNGRWITTSIATRGERLLLARLLFQGDVPGGGGALEIDHLSVLEFGDDARFEVIVLFEPTDLDAAYAELDARYEAGEGAMHPVGFSGAIARRDWGAIAAMCGPEFVEQDHRSLAVLGTSRDPEAWAQNFRVLVDLAPDTVARFGHVRPCPRGSLWTLTWEGSRAGGRYEIPMVGVTELDAQGKFARIDFYDPEQLDQAHARFAELAESAPPAEPFANAATRAFDELFAGWKAREWHRFRALFAADFRYYDRTPIAQLQLDGEQWIAFTRKLRELRLLRGTGTTLATRGERLALARSHLEMAEGDVGPSEIVAIFLYETNARGEVVAVVRFDGDDLNAAYTELDARYDAGEGAALKLSFSGFVRSIANRDWEALVAGCAPTLVEHDHRPIVNLGITYGPEAWVQKNVRTYVDLAPDSLPRVFHVRACARGSMWHIAWEGTREGGRYEIPMVGVSERDDLGRTTRVDIYEPEQLDQARARFAELTAPAPSAEPFANAASATVAPVIAAMIAHDWQRFAALFADEFRMSDHRRVVQLELDRDQYIAFTREVADGRTIRATSELLATRGERLALTRPVYEFSDADVGPSEIAFLILTEVNAAGRIVACVRWDLEDLDAAYAELDARYQAGEGAARPPLVSAYTRAIATRDWNAAAAMCAPEFVEYDHRPLALFAPTQGGEAWAQSDRTLVELAPDTMVRIDHVRLNRRGALSHVTWFGSRDGSDYEIPIAVVIELDEHSKFVRSDMYDPEQLDEARTRFAALAAPAPSAARFANAATRAAERIIAHWRARDWQGLAQMLPAGLWFQDQRRIALLEGDREKYIEWLRVTGEMPSTDIEVELLATRGDRLALQRRRVHLAGGDVGPSEMANVTVVATDEAGDPVAVVHFDEDALDAAYAELDARWRAGEAASHLPVTAYHAAFVRALASRDWDGLAALHAPTLVAHNHRSGGWDVLRAPSAYVGALRTTVDLAPDALDRADHIRTSERGLIAEIVRVGTRDAGAFETPFLWVVELDAAGLAQRLDFYDPHHLDAARARFEELSAAAATSSAG